MDVQLVIDNPKGHMKYRVTFYRYWHRFGKDIAVRTVMCFLTENSVFACYLPLSVL